MTRDGVKTLIRNIYMLDAFANGEKIESWRIWQKNNYEWFVNT